MGPDPALTENISYDWRELSQASFLSRQITRVFRDKRFVAASILSSRQKTYFVATKMILVAARANGNFSDSVRGRCWKLCMLLTCISASHVLTSYGHLNPFTAMLASLGKRPIKVPNLKSLRLCPSLLEHMKEVLSKRTELKFDLL